jgi:hypothetical protein
MWSPRQASCPFYPWISGHHYIPRALFRTDERAAGATTIEFCILERLNPPDTMAARNASTPEPVTKVARRHEASWRRALLLVTIAATAVIAPMVFLGQASGHDIQFHLASWMDVAHQWREGILYPRWAEWANWGFGEPRFLFYPPASWMAGAALGSLLPWKFVPGAYLWLTLIGAGMAMWKLSREWLASPQAEAAALFFAINPYNLVIVYYRSDYAELLAIALLPLLVLYALRVMRNGSKHIPMLALLFSAIWLSNAPAAVIATYSLSLVLVVGCVLQRGIRPLLRGGSAMVCGFGLASFYILPAAWEQRWVQITEAVGDNFRPSQNFLFTHSTDIDFQAFNWKVSYVAAAVILATILAVAISARVRRQFPELWWTCVVLGAASALLMVPLSALAWNHLPKLHFVQFPWRWLGPLNLAFAFLTAGSMNSWRKGWAKWLLVALVLGGIGAAATKMVNDGWWDSCDAPFIAGEISSGHGYEGTDEYSPVGVDRSDLLPDDPAYGTDGRIAIFDLASGKIVTAAEIQLHISEWSPEGKSFTAETADETQLALHILDYPAWEATLDGVGARISAAPDTGQILITVPPGAHRVEVRFRRTWDRTAGDAISLISAIGLLGFAFLRTRKSSALGAE